MMIDVSFPQSHHLPIATAWNLGPCVVWGSHILPIRDNNNLHHLSDADKPRIRSLQQRMHEVMQQETAAVEERIRMYTDQQYAMLKMQRLRVEQELNTLCSVINSVPELLLNTSGGNLGVGGDPNSPTSAGGNGDSNNSDLLSGANNNNNVKTLMETPPATPDNTPMSIGNSPPMGASGVASNAGAFFKHRTPNKVKNVSWVCITGIPQTFNPSSRHIADFFQNEHRR